MDFLFQRNESEPCGRRSVAAWIFYLFTANYYPEGKWYNADFWDVIAERCLFCREQKNYAYFNGKKKGMETYAKETDSGYFAAGKRQNIYMTVSWR